MTPESDERDAQGSSQLEPGGTDPTRATRDPNVVRVMEEDLSVGREREETGRVRVRVVTHEHEQAVDVPLTQEHVEVERIAIGRDIEAIPPRRQEGETTIVPVVEEVVDVRRKLVLKEEIHIRLVRSTEQHRENVTLRRQEAVIDRLPAEQPPTEQKSD